MRRRTRKMKVAVAPEMIVICLLSIISIFMTGVVCGLSRRSEPLYVIDERQESTEAPTETQPESTGTFGTESLPVEEANLGIVSVPAGYTTERKSEASVHDGLLLQIDDTCPFSGTTSYLTAFQSKNDYYRMKNMELKACDDTVRAMNSLAEAYYQQTGKTDLLVYSTTERYEAEGSLCPDILPDRDTGFCLDLAFLNEDGTISAMTPANQEWLKENAWQFGFIFSAASCAYHLRYVGDVHAAIMKTQNLTLAEYLERVRQYHVFSPYESVSPDGRKFVMYYVQSAAFGSTDVPVPENQPYTISGNNTDGYIIWTYTD